LTGSPRRVILSPSAAVFAGRAFGWGPKGRWFKSSRPDLTKPPDFDGFVA
jgi:hypothetical protein